MKNRLKKNSHRKKAQILGLAALITISLGLRVTNLTFGFPVLYVIPDEVANYQSALTMLATKSPLTISHYPPLGSYIQIPFFAAIYLGMRILNLASSFEAFQFFLITHEGALLFVPRLISALCGVASIIIAYRFTQALYPQKKRLAFFTLIMLTFSITHLQLSTIGKPIMPAVFLSWLFIYYLYKSTSAVYPTRLLLQAMLALTGAIGFYFGMLFYLLLYIQVVIVTTRFKQKLRALSLILIPLAAFLISLHLKVGTYIPHHLEAWQKFQANIAAGLAQTVITYLTQMILTEPILILGFFGGLIFYKQLHPFLRQLVLFSLFYLLIFILMYWYSMRYILPIFLPMILVMMHVFFQIFRTTIRKHWQWVIGVIVVLLAVLPGLTWYTRYRETPTFIDTRQWINKHISPQTRIGYLGARFSGFTPAPASIELIQAKTPHAYERAKKLLPTDSYPENVREVVYLENVVDIHNKELLLEYMHSHDVHYLIYYYWDPGLHHTGKDWIEFPMVYKSSPYRVDKGEVSSDFVHWSGSIRDMIGVYRFGPYFEILEILPREKGESQKIR